MLENKVVLKYARVSPRKARLVCDQVRGFDVIEALDMLKYTNKKVVEPILKLLNSCIVNLKNLDDSKNLNSFYIKKIYVDAGPVMKRFRARARGRAGKIKKRMSRITLVLSEIKGTS